ncbi:hypothetical protein QE417_002921 [Mucilaginibacter terrae]|uniref:Outer membrane protein beta-barrel domain-containing protein n=2 Tax=Mucilaginibacter terrae TaxID=1955052 RepID=A0ABU3GVQ4_9SPHI|nr:hypothetical protein [Mucilaginibacter terrae]
MFNMKVSAILVTLLITFSINNKVFSQARNSIGVGAGLNLPINNDYKVGRDRVIQANIFARNKFALMPTLGIEDIKGKLRSDYSVGFLNLAAKYYATQRIFVFAGPSCYVGGNDGGVIGLGGTAGAGYDWAFDKYSSLEFSLRTDLLPSYFNISPLAGLRVAYKFNFSKKQGKYRVPEEDDMLN